MKAKFPFDDGRYTTQTVPYALRCASCTSALFQAFSEDVMVVVDKECQVCYGRGAAPIPPAELGL